MSSQAKPHKPFVSLANWFYARILILELISVFVLLVLLYVNIRSEADLGLLLVVPIAFLGAIYYLLTYLDIETGALGLILLKLSSYASTTAVLAILLKYMAWPAYEILLISAGLALLACIIVIGIMRFGKSSDKILSAELMVRIYVLTIVCGVLVFVPNSQLLELGFALVG